MSAVPSLPKSSPDSVPLKDRILWLAIRRGLLAVIDGIEVYLEFKDRTSAIRKDNK